MTRFIIITTQDNISVNGEHYARDDGGDVHVYPTDEPGIDPVLTVDDDEFVAIATASDIDDWETVADDLAVSSSPFLVLNN